ncbi:hypothetical protein ACOSP7_004505 [Xanthoceras sorbifolium]
MDWWKAIKGKEIYEISFRLVSWTPPLPGWIKVNVDGSVKNEYIIAGGVIRKHDRSWVRSFSMNIGCGSVLTAELWGLLEGMKMAKEAGFKYVFVESDSADAVSLVNGDLNPNQPCFQLAQGCKNLVNDDWHCVVSHVLREENSLAVGLANFGHLLERGI